MDSYKTVLRPGTAAITEKKSEFIGHIAPAHTEEEALAVLAAVKTEHRTARHNVYAYRLRENSRTRYSDDGEPAKTAGLPVLSALEHAGLEDCAVVVTRYFGGVLLGTGGLVRAYTAASQAAIAAAEPVWMKPCSTVVLTMPYPFYESAVRVLSSFGADVAEPVFTDAVEVTATVEEKDAAALLEQLGELSAGKIKAAQGEVFFGPLRAGTEKG